MERRGLLKMLLGPALLPMMPARWWERFLAPVVYTRDALYQAIQEAALSIMGQVGYTPKMLYMHPKTYERLQGSGLDYSCPAATYKPAIQNFSPKELEMEYTPKKLSCRDCGAEWASKTQLRSVRRAKEGFGGHKALCPSCSVPMTRAQAEGGVSLALQHND